MRLRALYNTKNVTDIHPPDDEHSNLPEHRDFVLTVNPYNKSPRVRLKHFGFPPCEICGNRFSDHMGTLRITLDDTMDVS